MPIQPVRPISALLLALAGVTLGGVNVPAQATVNWGTAASHPGHVWGRLLGLEDGSWLSVSTIFDGGSPSILRIHRSTDGLRTWDTLADVVEAGRNFDNGHLARIGGKLLLTGRSLIDGESYRLPVYRSLNAGRTWVRVSNVDSSEGAPGTMAGKGLWEPFLVPLEDGSVAVFYSNEKVPGHSQVLSEKVSQDHGSSWGPEIRPVAIPAGLRPGMPVVARMADGRHLLVYEVVGVGNADVHGKISLDGESWDDGLGTRIPGQHCGPYVLSVTDGRLLITSCENSLAVSEDLAESWIRADPSPWDLGFAFSWPALYEVRAGRVASVISDGSIKLKTGVLAAPRVWPESILDDFSDGKDDGWIRYGEGVSLAEGRYILDAESGSTKSLTGNVDWADGAFETDMLLDVGGDAGLVFRARNPDITGPDALFGYYAGLDARGFVILGKMDGSWTELARKDLSVPLGTWRHLRVVTQGARISVFVDGVAAPRISIEDSSHPRGRVGLRVFRARAGFDNVAFHAGVSFRRGDANRDGSVDLSDAIIVLNWLFVGGPEPSCMDAADSNDDSEVDISDAMGILTWLFLGGADLPTPFRIPGFDATPDSLDCRG